MISCHFYVHIYINIYNVSLKEHWDVLITWLVVLYDMNSQPVRDRSISSRSPDASKLSLFIVIYLPFPKILKADSMVDHKICNSVLDLTASLAGLYSKYSMMLICYSGWSCISSRYTHLTTNMSMLLYIDVSRLLVGMTVCAACGLFSTFCAGLFNLVRSLYW